MVAVGTFPVIVHVPLVVVSVSPSVAVPLSEGAAVFTGADPPPVGGPPALDRIPTLSPSLPASWPVDPEASSKPAQVVGSAPPANVALPLMFGELAPDHMLLVFVLIALESPMFGDVPETLFVNVSPLPVGSPDLWLFSNTDPTVQAWMGADGSCIEQSDGSAPPSCVVLWLTTDPVVGVEDYAASLHVEAGVVGDRVFLGAVPCREAVVVVVAEVAGEGVPTGGAWGSRCIGRRESMWLQLAASV